MYERNVFLLTYSCAYIVLGFVSYAVLCHAMLRYVMPYCAMYVDVMLCCATLYCGM